MHGVLSPDRATSEGVTVVDHPLVQHKLTLMRDKTRSTKGFRQLLNEIGMLLAYEVTRDLPLETVAIETPLEAMEAPQIAGKKLVLAPILRAGVGFLDGMLDLVPSARVAHVGLYRDPDTLQAVEYYFKAPSDLADRWVLVLDPMLATANSAVAAIDRLKERGARDLRFVCLLAAPEGIDRLRGAHPDVPIWTAADRQPPQRPRLHRAGPRRRRRPHVRHALMRLIVADWGTTRFRAYLVDDGKVVDRVASPEGIASLKAGRARGRVRPPVPEPPGGGTRGARAPRRHGRQPGGLGRRALRPLPRRPGRGRGRAGSGRARGRSPGLHRAGHVLRAGAGRRRRDARRGDPRASAPASPTGWSASPAPIRSGSSCAAAAWSGSRPT